MKRLDKGTALLIGGLFLVAIVIPAFMDWHGKNASDVVSVITTDLPLIVAAVFAYRSDKSSKQSQKDVAEVKESINGKLHSKLDAMVTNSQRMADAIVTQINSNAPTPENVGISQPEVTP